MAAVISERIIGLYSIICNETGHVYVGATADMPHRYMTHFCQLRNGTNLCGRLQRLFNCCGEQAFSFVPMFCVELAPHPKWPKYLDVSPLTLVEKEWIVGLKSEIGELSLNAVAGAGGGIINKELVGERVLWRHWWPPFPQGGPPRLKGPVWGTFRKPSFGKNSPGASAARRGRK